MTEIIMEGTVETLHTWHLLRLPPEASRELPSRGMLMAAGTLNGIPVTAPLEPDGLGSHWFRVSDALKAAAALDAGSTVTLSLHLVKDWPEPEVPRDLREALESHDLTQRWQGITVRARWEWLRWVRSTPSAETRQRRIRVTCSKLAAGKNRPCCFDMSRCTEPAVCRNGVLTVPAAAQSDL